MTNMQEMLGSMGEGEEGIATKVDIVFVTTQQEVGRQLSTW